MAKEGDLLPRRPEALHRAERVAADDEVRPALRQGLRLGRRPLPVAVATRFSEVTGAAQLVEGYGLTETSPVTHANPLQGERRPGAIGLPMRTRTAGSSTWTIPTARWGRVSGANCVRGPQVMLGYWNRPEDGAHDAQRLAPHGRRRGDGTGRLLPHRGPAEGDDRRLGFNVYPTEVEEVLFHHPDREVRGDRRARRADR